MNSRAALARGSRAGPACVGGTLRPIGLGLAFASCLVAEAEDKHLAPSVRAVRLRPTRTKNAERQAQAAEGPAHVVVHRVIASAVG